MKVPWASFDNYSELIVFPLMLNKTFKFDFRGAEFVFPSKDLLNGFAPLKV